MAKIWLFDVVGNFADAVLLVLGMSGINANLGFTVTRLVIYAVQVISAILLSDRPRPKSAYLPGALQIAGLFVCKQYYFNCRIQNLKTSNHFMNLYKVI